MAKITVKRKPSLSSRVFILIIAVIMLLTGLHLLMQHLNLNVYHELHGQVYEFSNRVDYDDEVSVPTWVSQVLLLAIGISAFFAAFLQRSKATKRVWLFIGTIGVLFSLDEVAALHEFTLQTIHLAFFKEAGPTLTSNAWLVVSPLVLMIGAALLWQVFKHIPRKTALIMFGGGLLFTTGAVFFDMLTTTDGANTFYVKGVLIAVEESLELIGSATVLYAVLDYLETNFSDRFRVAHKTLKG